ncbi:MAG: zinc-ribbon domain-containing protein, partial [candidate division WOR-3 bacterium]
MIKVRIETGERKVIEHLVSLTTLNKWLEDGILTPDTEVWSETLTGGVWKKIGDLIFDCSECGAEISVKDKICPRCGADVSEVEEDV